MAEEEIIFRDFTRKRPPVGFGIDDQRFECVKALGTESLQDLIRMYRGGELQAAVKENDADRIMTFVRNMFKIFILEESFSRFVEKLQDKKDPVDIHQLLDIVAWIVEVYTKRPTQPSQSSSDTSQSGDGGTDSPAGAQLEGWIPSNSIVTGSST